MKKAPRPTSPREAIIICWLWILGLLSIYLNPKLRVRVFFIPSIQYPTRKDLATVYLNLKTAAYPLVDAVDLGVSEIIYLEDPDGNSLEVVLGSPQNRMAQEAQW